MIPEVTEVQRKEQHFGQDRPSPVLGLCGLVGWGNRDNYYKATENGSHKDGVTELTDFQRWLRKGQESNIKDETMLMRVEPGEGKRTTGLKIKQQKGAKEKSPGPKSGEVWG